MVEQMARVTYPVASSSSDRVWQVSFYEDGTVWCECPAYKFQGGAKGDREDCKHVTEARRVKHESARVDVPVAQLLDAPPDSGRRQTWAGLSVSECVTQSHVIHPGWGYSEHLNYLQYEEGISPTYLVEVTPKIKELLGKLTTQALTGKLAQLDAALAATKAQVSNARQQVAEVDALL